MANVYPWAEQAQQPGYVFTRRVEPPEKADTVVKLARRWARRNSVRVETRVFGDVVLLRWSPAAGPKPQPSPQSFVSFS